MRAALHHIDAEQACLYQDHMYGCSKRAGTPVHDDIWTVAAVQASGMTATAICLRLDDLRPPCRWLGRDMVNASADASAAVGLTT